MSSQSNRFKKILNFLFWVLTGLLLFLVMLCVFAWIFWFIYEVLLPMIFGKENSRWILRHSNALIVISALILSIYFFFFGGIYQQFKKFSIQGDEGNFPFLLLLAVIFLAGCAGGEPRSPSAKTRDFFAAAHEANCAAVRCLSPNQVDLSGYTRFMGIKYPQTQKVDVLSCPPSRPYQAFAVLASPAPGAAETSDHNWLEDLKTQARALGADAIILSRRADSDGVPGQQQSCQIEAIAVKYRR
jgi:hypothetical protein